MDRHRTWLFGPGADTEQHDLMTASTADVLILDYEDFTPPELKEKARELTPRLLHRWRDAGISTAVRINALDGQGLEDLEAAIRKQARGSERIGFVASSGASRLKPLGINVHETIDATNWFLNGKEDVRSSYYLEDLRLNSISKA